MLTVSARLVQALILAVAVLLPPMHVCAAGTSSQVPRADAPSQRKPFPVIDLAQRLRGEAAVRALGTRLTEVAAWYGMTAKGFAGLLRQDKRAWLDRQGRLLYIDEHDRPLNGTTATDGGATVAAAPAPLEQTFQLHSRPGAKRVIYLDFDGQVVSNTAWNNSYGLAAIDAKPYDLDGNGASFSSTELERIQYIWQRVAEDFAPFDVDVTTEEPTADALSRSGSGDDSFGTRVVISADWTDLTSSPCNCGGIAYVGAFDDSSESYKPAWVFFNKLGGGNEKYVAEAISHEAGHNLGLSHDGSNTTSYYQGHGSAATGWAPIMGVGYYKELVQWSKGEYPYANQFQDDLQVIQNFGAPLRGDDHGDDPAAASSLDVVAAAGVAQLSGSGVIAMRGDVDLFRFESGAGGINISVLPSTRSPNLDIEASLYDANGTLLASSNPVDSLNADISLSGLAGGTYFLKIDGVGKGDLSTGYSDYASLGEYAISGSVPAPYGGLPVAVASSTPSTGQAPLPVSFSSEGSYDPDGGALSYQWNFGDGSAVTDVPNPSHTYGAEGSYLATLTVTDTAGSVDTAKVTVTVAGPPPSVHVEAIVMATSSKRNGTQATATVSIKDAAGMAVGGATVTGTWSGVVSGSGSGTTSTKGTVKLTSPRTKSSGTFVFTVTGVSKAGYVYDAGQNMETSDSVTK